MARQYLNSGRGGILQLKGFDELYEKIAKLENSKIDAIARKSFEQDCNILKEALYSRAADSIPESLTSKLSESKEIGGNRYSFAYGWDKTKNPEEFVKVCYLNYGTPYRYSSKGYRGKINPRSFITNAKRSAAQKIKANHKKLLQDVMAELRR